MFLAGQDKASEPGFEVDDQSQIFRSQPLGIINVVQLAFIVGEGRDAAVGQNAEDEDRQRRNNRRKKQLAGDRQIAQQVTHEGFQSPGTS